jgi:hypothetical protein
MSAGGELRQPIPAAQPLEDPDEGLRVCHADAAYGLGVETLVGRRAGEVIHRFTGDIGPELRLHTLQVGPDAHISNTRFIGFLLHSCAPNCRLDMATFELVALADVRAGGLLTIDYAATEDRLYRQFACHCGADHCRRWITGRAEPMNAEGRAWLASADVA